MEQIRTLTIVKTDIQGFTERVGRLTAEELDTFLEEHRQLIFRVFAKHGGWVVKGLGDSYLVTFESSRSALHACIDLQREIEIWESHRSPENCVRLKCAAAAGDVLIQEGDIFGNPVNIVARLEAVTPPGEIYFTEAVYQNLSTQEIASECVGEVVLKGIAVPVRAYRTTFRRQTRTVQNAAVLVTDLISFTNYAMSAELERVESILSFWQESHARAIAARRGLIRAVAGDSFLMTFADVADAARAWLCLHHDVESFNQKAADGYRVRFCAGVGVGDIRIFRSCIYGLAVNHASKACECCRLLHELPLVLALNKSWSAPPELATEVSVEKCDPTQFASLNLGSVDASELTALRPIQAGSSIRR